MNVSRREMIAMSAVAGLGVTSGCSLLGEDAGTDSGTTGWETSRFIPDTASDLPSPYRIKWLSEDRSGLRSGGRSTVWAAQPVFEANPTDRLLAGVFFGYVSELYANQERYEPYPVFPDLGPTATPAERDFDSAVGTTERLLRVAHTTVFVGSYDVEELDARAPAFERVGQSGVFTIFARDGTVAGETDTPIRPRARVFAASSDAVIFPAANDRQALTTLRKVLDTGLGERQRLIESGDGQAWAVSVAGDGGIVFGLWSRRTGADTDIDLLAEAVPEASFDRIPRVGPTRGEVYSVSLTPSELTGEFAAVYPDQQRPDRDTIDAAVGHSAASRDVTVDGRRVSVTATWRRPASPTTGE
jgi:hypothetical protein